MTEKQAIWESILHWRRMIRYVERKCYPQACADEEYLFSAIGEAWSGYYCALCEIIYYGDRRGCSTCLLFRKYGNCSNRCAENAWHDVSRAGTWKDWLHHARRMLKQLESLREVK